MASSFKVPVAPAVLVWARTSARMSLEAAAKAADVAVSVVEAWESGTQQPSLAQLRKLGERYRRPLAVFLLSEPPKDWQALRDFRSVDTLDEQTPELTLAVREAHERRRIAVEMAGLLAEAVTSFDVTAKLDDEPEAVAAAIRSALNVSITKQREFKSADAALSQWRAAVEATGVLVFGFSRVAVSEARGFSFSEFPLPAVAINASDAPPARAFTLMHELAHIALRSGDVLCDLSDRSKAGQVEVFCNHVAGAVLVPAHELLSDQAVRRAGPASTWAESDVERLAKAFRVSREVILRRLLILGRTNAGHYAAWRDRLQADFAQYRAKLDESERGPKYQVAVISRLGRLLPRLVLAAYDRDSISTSAASGYLGVKTKWLEVLAQEITKANDATL